MKPAHTFILTALMTFGILVNLNAQELTAKEVIREADDQINGEESSISEMSMTIVRPTW